MASKGRRPLAFRTIDEVAADVDRLLAGHTTVGRWSLGQMCKHMSDAIRYSVDGYPMAMPWVVRRLIGPIAFRYIDKKGGMPAGLKAPKAIEPAPGLEAGAEASALRHEIERFQSASLHGSLAESPIFGRLTPAQWERLHCIHAAHHLSFAWPAAGGGVDGGVA